MSPTIGGTAQPPLTSPSPAVCAARPHGTTNEVRRANGLAFGRMTGRLPLDGLLARQPLYRRDRSESQRREHWDRQLSAPGQLHRLVQVHGELRKGRDVPAARRILEANDQLLTERAPYLHERLHRRLVLAAFEPADGSVARADALGAVSYTHLR